MTELDSMQKAENFCPYLLFKILRFPKAFITPLAALKKSTLLLILCTTGLQEAFAKFDWS